jgi:hypothetical protein
MRATDMNNASPKRDVLLKCWSIRVTVIERRWFVTSSKTERSEGNSSVAAMASNEGRMEQQSQ